MGVLLGFNVAIIYPIAAHAEGKIYYVRKTPVGNQPLSKSDAQGAAEAAYPAQALEVWKTATPSHPDCHTLHMRGYGGEHIGERMTVKVACN